MSLPCSCRSVAALLSLAVSLSAGAQSTYRITELFSNQDGSIQFIRLTEQSGLDGQNAFHDLAITVTSRGQTRQWTFPGDLATTATSHRDVFIGNSPEIPDPDLGARPAIFEFTNCCVVVAHLDYVLPPNFLPTDGGTVDFAGIDRFTYASLPVDGASALYGDYEVDVAQLPSAYCPGDSAFCPPVVHPTPTLVEAVEYYNAAQDHYFLTASAPDIDALDSGRFQGWKRTDESFLVAARASTVLGLEYTYYGSPVCRFYLPPPEGDSHFLTGFSDECAAVQSKFPNFVLETSAAFYATLPASTGECPAIAGSIDGNIPLRPVFRLWNGRADANHRYTTRQDLRQAMMDQGWIPEGYGPLGVAFCVR